MVVLCLKKGKKSDKRSKCELSWKLGALAFYLSFLSIVWSPVKVSNRSRPDKQAHTAPIKANPACRNPTTAQSKKAPESGYHVLLVLSSSNGVMGGGCVSGCQVVVLPTNMVLRK
ncbi:hypothetical protein V8F06_006177 [Rhypophila decipiens]